MGSGSRCNFHPAILYNTIQKAAENNPNDWAPALVYEIWKKLLALDWPSTWPPWHLRSKAQDRKCLYFSLCVYLHAFQIHCYILNHILYLLMPLIMLSIVFALLQSHCFIFAFTGFLAFMLCLIVNSSPLKKRQIPLLCEIANPGVFNNIRNSNLFRSYLTAQHDLQIVLSWMLLLDTVLVYFSGSGVHLP